MLPKVVIIGAGPAGLTAAIFLGMRGIPVTVYEKHAFPRDKVCGDCLGGFALSVLNQMGNDIIKQFEKLDHKLIGGGVHFFGPKQEVLSVEATHFINNSLKEVALIKRIDFDDFLFRQAASLTSVTFKQEEIRTLKRDRSLNQILLYNQVKDQVGSANMVILATGSNQHLIRMLTGKLIAKNNRAAGLRCYFKNVVLPDANTYIELHFLNHLAPGYFWIFPLPGNQVNVGLGLRSDKVSEKRIDLKQTLLDIIKNHPGLKERFKNAEMISAPMGYPLFVHGSKGSISGDNFLLAGDAANLIEPLFGEGIGSAMYSGLYAARHIEKSLSGQLPFDAQHNRKYDNMVYEKLGTTLKFSAMMHKVAFHPRLMSYIFNRMNENEDLKELFQKLINGRIPKTRMNGLRLLLKTLIPFS